MTPNVITVGVRMCFCNYKNQKILDLPDHLAVHKQNRTVCIDLCISGTIQHLFNRGIQTLGCCCMHGKGNPNLIIAEEYKSEESKQKIKDLIAQVDNRNWDILQWNLIEV